MLPKGTFDGSIAVVTGGGSGIGEETARQLSSLGAVTILVGRRADALERVADSIRGEGGKAEFYSGDVRDRARTEEMVAQICDRYGKIDHLVNNAAGNFRSRPEDLSPNAWDAVVDIVLGGTWNWTQVVGARSLASGHALSVVSIGSVGASFGSATTAHSASAKAAVLTLTKSLAAAWGPHGIRLNVVTPGPIENTPGVERLIADAGEHSNSVAALPLRRFGTRVDIAHAVTYLLSDYASYVTGTNLFVDGGAALRS